MKISRDALGLLRPEVLAWSRRKKLRHPFAGLSFFRKTSDPTYFNLVSRHWPHLMCWSWYLAWHRRKGDERRSWRPIRLHNAIAFGPLYLSWQHYGWMVDSRYQAEILAWATRRLPPRLAA